MDRSTRRTLRRKRCDYGTPAHLLIASRQGKTGCRRGGRRQRAFSAYRAIGGPMAKPAREWHCGKVGSVPTRWESGQNAACGDEPDGKHGKQRLPLVRQIICELHAPTPVCPRRLALYR